MSDEYGPITLQPFDYEDPRNYAAMPLETIRDLAEQIVRHLCHGGETGDTWQITCGELLPLIKAHDIVVTSGKIAHEAHLVTLEEAERLTKDLSGYKRAHSILSTIDVENSAKIRTLQARIEQLTADQQTKTWLLSKRHKLIRKLGRKISSLVRGNKS